MGMRILLLKPSAKTKFKSYSQLNNISLSVEHDIGIASERHFPCSPMASKLVKEINFNMCLAPKQTVRLNWLSDENFQRTIYNLANHTL